MKETESFGTVISVRLSPQQILDCVRIAHKHGQEYQAGLSTLIRGIVRLAITLEGLEPLDLNTEGALELLKGFGVDLTRTSKRRTRELFVAAQQDSIEDKPFVDPEKVRLAKAFIEKIIPPPVRDK